MDQSITSVSDTDLSDEYDIIASPSIPLSPPSEPVPAPASLAQLKGTLELTKENIQAHVANHLGKHFDETRTVRVYVDGTFEGLNAGHALQLRQAKLSFPSTRLIVGVLPSAAPYAEVLELLRHIRWVDQVLPDVPLQLDADFLSANTIDYVAVEEGITVDPRVDKARLKGYDTLKASGKIIPTRRTLGLTVTSLRPHSPLPTPPVQAQNPLTTPTITRKPHLLPDPPASKEPREPFNDPDAIPEPIDIYGIGI